MPSSPLASMNSGGGAGAGAGNIGTVNVEFTGRTTGLEAAAARAEATVKKTAGVIGATQAANVGGATAGAAAGAAAGAGSASSLPGTFGTVIGSLRGFRLGLVRAISALGVFGIVVGALVGGFRLLTKTIPDFVFGLEDLRKKQEFVSKSAVDGMEEAAKKIKDLQLRLNKANDEIEAKFKLRDDAKRAVLAGAASREQVEAIEDFIKILIANRDKIEADLKLFQDSLKVANQAIAEKVTKEVTKILSQVRDDQRAQTRALQNAILTAPSRVGIIGFGYRIPR